MSFAEWEQARHKIVSIGVENRPNWKLKIWHRRKIVVPLPLQLRCNGECGRRLSKGQASLPLRSPCTTLALSIRNDKALAEKMLGGANISPRRRSLKGKETDPPTPFRGRKGKKTKLLTTNYQRNCPRPCKAVPYRPPLTPPMMGRTYKKLLPGEVGRGPKG